MKRYTASVNIRHTFHVDLPEEFFDSDGQLLDDAVWDHDAHILQIFVDIDEYQHVEIETWEGELAL